MTEVAADPSQRALFRVGAALGRARPILRANLLPYLLAVLLADLPGLAADLAGGSLGYEAERGLSVLGSLLDLLVGTGIVFSAVRFGRGEPVGLGTAINRAGGRLVALIVASLLGFLLALAGLVALIVPGLLMLGVLFILPPACVVERLGPLASLRRSFALSRGHRWKLCALFLGLLLTAVLAAVPGILLEALIPAIRGAGVLYTDLVVGPLYLILDNVLAATAYLEIVALTEGPPAPLLAEVFD